MGVEMRDGPDVPPIYVVTSRPWTALGDDPKAQREETAFLVSTSQSLEVDNRRWHTSWAQGGWRPIGGFTGLNDQLRPLGPKLVSAQSWSGVLNLGTGLGADCQSLVTTTSPQFRPFHPMPQIMGLQLPVELWRIILFEAVATSILPYEDPNRTRLQVGLVECIDLFDNSCRAYSEYQTNQSVLTNLRLVCRTWALLLQDFYGLCALTDLNKIMRPSKSREYLSRVERVHIDEMAILGCKCSNRAASLNGTCILLQTSQNDVKPLYPGVKYDFLSKVLHPQVRILSISVGSMNLDEPLASAPNLLALSLHMGIDFVWNATISRTLRGITHLSLSAVTPGAIEKFPPSMTLENTRYLALNLLLVGTHSTRNKASQFIGEWTFPNLHSLILRGIVNQVFLGDVYDFIQGCGKFVSELIMELHWSDAEIDGQPMRIFDGWGWFPNLRVYGTEFDTLIYVDPEEILEYDRPEEAGHLTLLVSGFFPPLEHLQEHIDVLANRLLNWQVSKVIFTETWDSLHDRLTWRGLSRDVRSQDVLRKTKQIMDAIALTSISLHDKMGSKLQSEDGQILWNALSAA
ncbi:7054_t:CDS:2 [Acaulospora colombiana]|uniref:7054_t:CDS:1 n=1 Tax=Acaulospora colombiana TaxID=27376 RepID=A0ACA9N3S7_9GLOM|nr:7054_t:CDS:2 [Acaulospora colombiana]